MLKPLISAALLGAVLVSCSTGPVAPAEAGAGEALRPQETSGGWRDDFETLDLTRWWVSGGGWTPFWVRDGLTGGWEPGNVTVQGGHLVLRLDVGTDLWARGAEIGTHQTYGYGRYEARLRAASRSADPATSGPASSGNISAFFSYVNDSETEIDHEIEGQNPQLDWMGAYQTTGRHDYGVVDAGADLSQGFHTYRWDWSPDRIDFYRDGVWQRATTSVRPSTPAHLLFNLWPTNSGAFGGQATPGTSYLLVDYVSFTPSADLSVPAPAPSDDTPAGAASLTAATAQKGSVGASDPQDWFTFVGSEQGGSATVNLSTAWNSDLEVYAEDGTTLLGASRTPKGSTDRVTLQTAPGTRYYARVKWASRTPGYTLSVSGAVR